MTKIKHLNRSDIIHSSKLSGSLFDLGIYDENRKIRNTKKKETCLFCGNEIIIKYIYASQKIKRISGIHKKGCMFFQYAPRMIKTASTLTDFMDRYRPLKDSRWINFISRYPKRWGDSYDIFTPNNKKWCIKDVYFDFNLCTWIDSRGDCIGDKFVYYRKHNEGKQ